jgi:hypothetical protein
MKKSQGVKLLSKPHLHEDDVEFINDAMDDTHDEHPIDSESKS